MQLSSPDPNSTTKKFFGLDQSQKGEINLQEMAGKLDLDRDTGLELGENTELGQLLAKQKEDLQKYK